MASKPKLEKKTLTLGEKIEVIRRYEKGGVGARGLAQDFGVGKTQIQNIIKRKREHIEDYENNAPTSKRRNVRQTGNEGINQLC
ncbi:Hypp8879 [Branchiostoma lanceolatum]|uniref:Hypp8879 protein n=2 Tax=Branchiostoma lanceolatum TaxID=7740 RepID=A0A8J9ZBP8_BRALA|nr:Hypp8879 [Branchiostoma lanceolatum]